MMLMKKKWFAIVRWSIDDIKELRPNWTDKQCRDFLYHNSNRIKDGMVEMGWHVIEFNLDEQIIKEVSKETGCSVKEIKAAKKQWAGFPLDYHPEMNK